VPPDDAIDQMRRLCGAAVSPDRLEALTTRVRLRKALAFIDRGRTQAQCHRNRQHDWRGARVAGMILFQLLPRESARIASSSWGIALLAACTQSEERADT
jgi:hypothetical protein